MKNKVFVLVTVGLMVLNLTGFAVAGDTPKAAGARSAELVSLLPASEAVITFDSQRFFTDALPSILASNQAFLKKIMSKVDEMQTKSGIDFRQFDDVAVGVSAVSTAPGKYDFDPVAIARGTFSATGLVAMVKIASNGTFRQEKIGERTVYIFSVKEVAKKNAPKAASPAAAGAVDKTLKVIDKEIALVSLNPTTLAIGSPARVRQALSGSSHIDPELTALVLRRPNSIVNFAAKTPAGLSQYIPMENDVLGANLDAIRFMSGSMDVAGGTAAMQLMARTATAEQATGIHETIEGLMFLGKNVFSGSSRTDQQAYARIIQNAKVAKNGSEVTIDLTVPQSDIDVLIGLANLK